MLYLDALIPGKLTSRQLTSSVVEISKAFQNIEAILS